MFFNDFSSQIERQKINTPVLQWLPRRDLRPGYLMIVFMFFACFLTHCKTGVLIFDAQFGWKIMLFSRVFRVLSDPLRDRGVDFLTVNIDEKSCYFRVFFACFLTDCKTGVLIFSCYAERRVLVTLIIKALNYAKPSAQPQPGPGKKCIIFLKNGPRTRKLHRTNM